MNILDYIESKEDPWDLKKIGKNQKIVKVLKKDIGKVGKIIDIGGAYGFYADALREMGNSVVVLDKSKKVITQGRKIFPKIRFVKSDANKIPFPSVSFDAALCMGTMMYIENRGKFFSEVNRILKKGGIFLLYERNKKAILNSVINMFKNTEQPLDKRELFIEKQEIKNLARSHGFFVRKIRGSGSTFLTALLTKK